jgi:predicted ATPase
MAITKIFVGNFKGIAAPTWIEIRPITIFVGANSSGKSTCIHALASLSQTVKVTNNTRPLILDDEFASVHLGRFIEVIHSRSYQDVISLGLELSKVPIVRFLEKDGKPHHDVSEVTASAEYSFKCALRTQEMHLADAQIKIGEQKYSAKRDKKGYLVTAGTEADSVKGRFTVETAFMFDEKSFFLTSPKQYQKFASLLQFQTNLKEALTNTLYLGPFRQAPQRKYPTRGSSPAEVGAMGESTVTLLANETIQTQSRTHINQIAKWLKDLGLAKALTITRLARSDLFDISMTLQDGESFPIADLGYGLSQVLPVLTQCSFAKKGSTLLFEQPEIHLHTASARKLAGVFIDTAREKDARVVVETHSPELVKQVFAEIRSGRVPIQDVAVYKVVRNEGRSVVSPIAIEVIQGDIDVIENWEAGISS